MNKYIKNLLDYLLKQDFHKYQIKKELIYIKI